MPKEELNCEKLRQILEMERMEKIRKNRALTKIDNDFYSDLTNYLNGLQKLFGEEYTINPTSPKTILLRDELNKAKNLSENIFETREEKIVTAALSTIKGGKPDLDLMVKEEKMLYNSLLKLLKESRKEMLSTKPETEENKTKLRNTEPTHKIFTEKPSVAEFTVPLEKHKPKAGHMIVRALDSISFVGSDEKEYNLTLNDVASLPIDTALLLCKTGKAEEIPIY
jgi:DNA replication initiation complex subunit (GINS family)